MKRGLAGAVTALLVLGCPRSGPPLTALPEAPLETRDAFRRFDPVLEYLRSQVDSAFPGAVIVIS